MSLLLNVCAALLLLAYAGQSAVAADLIAGKKLAAQCATCHGAGGIGTRPEIPMLAGQKEAYLAKALRDFRSGDRKDEHMNSAASSLSDQEIDNLAAYYRQLGPRSLETIRTR